MTLGGGIGSRLRQFGSDATKALDEAVNEDRIRLAVTGLSRAGKTVFITSLIHNLLALSRGLNTLPRLSELLTVNGVNRLHGAAVLPSGAALLPTFDYQAKLRGLAADEPTWPERTDDLAQVSIALELERTSAIGQRLGNRRVRLDILDYPGEWLLDLPLLELSFQDWSKATLDLLRQPPRDEIFRPFLSFIANLRLTDRADETVARQGHELYRQALLAVRQRHGLRYLQPGRFLCPGPQSDAPFMWFFPMEGAVSGQLRAHSMGALLRDRFETYKKQILAHFFEPHFQKFDRQIVLVDVLGALSAGRGAFDDTARSIKEIAEALSYGHRRLQLIRSTASEALRLYGRLPLPFSSKSDKAGQQLGRHRIEKVAFVATKCDHVPALKRDNLRNLLRVLVNPVDAHQTGQGASVSYHVAAALHSTEDGVAKMAERKIVDGSETMSERSVEVVKGVPMGRSKVHSFFVGEVPSNLPPESFWNEAYFDLPEFSPPPLDPTGQKGLRNLGIDAVMVEVLGDLLK